MTFILHLPDIVNRAVIDIEEIVYFRFRTNIISCIPKYGIFIRVKGPFQISSVSLFEVDTYAAAAVDIMLAYKLSQNLNSLRSTSYSDQPSLRANRAKIDKWGDRQIFIQYESTPVMAI